VNPPINERLPQMLAEMHNQARAAGTQQQAAYTDGSGNVIIWEGLLPGTNPAQYGILLTASNGNVVMFAGNAQIPDGSGRQNEVFELWRDDGTIALALADLGSVPGHAHAQALQTFDSQGNIIFADSGEGIANPYIPNGPFIDLTPPTNTTTSTSFVPMQWCDVIQQHPWCTAAALVQTPSGTVGQIRLTVSGVQIGTPVTVPSNSFTVFYTPAAAYPPPFNYLSRLIVQLEARVTSGAGAIGVRGMSCVSVQAH
jgi:hypothetical protein